MIVSDYREDGIPRDGEDEDDDTVCDSVKGPAWLMLMVVDHVSLLSSSLVPALLMLIINNFSFFFSIWYAYTYEKNP